MDSAQMPASSIPVLTRKRSNKKDQTQSAIIQHINGEVQSMAPLKINPGINQ